MGEADEAFFSRASVKTEIGKLSERKHWTIYVGAGATMDRTGTSWSDLVGELLREDFEDEGSRKAILKSAAPIEAATVAAQSYQNRFGDDRRDRLNDSIRSRLYRQPLSPSGKIVSSAIDLAVSCIAREGSAIIVTPNYDDFLIQECERRVDVPDYVYVPLGPEDGDEVDDPDHLEEGADESLEDLLEEILAEASKGVLWIVHVHGLLRSHVDPEGDLVANPVLSERDYWGTSSRTREILGRLFEDRSVLIAGSSMTDAPLLNALLDTQKSSSRDQRSAIMRVHENSLGGKHLARDFLRVRLQHFGVSLFPVDHYSQVAQLMTEVRLCGEVGAAAYLAHNSSVRYGPRLTGWWREWSNKPGSLPSRQASAHRYLRRKMPTLRAILDAPEAEPMKLEIWMRWQPERRRELRLWASSVGPWVDELSMRSAPLNGGEETVAVKAFSMGTVISQELDGPRWCTYLATPIWVGEEDGAEFAAGVAVVSSMHPQDASALGPKNSTRVSAALLDIHRIGKRLLDLQRGEGADPIPGK